MKLQNRVALVTGASRGLGSEIALALASEGADVVVNCSQNIRMAQAVAARIDEMGRRALAIQADVRETVQVDNMVKETVDTLGKLDILVNNAGVFNDSTVWKMTDQMWEEVLDTCLTGTFNCTRASINHMRQKGYGRIVSISSVVGQVGAFGASNYAAAKAGLLGFTKAVAKEVARKNITVNALALGYFEAGMLLRLPKRVQDAVIRQIPVGRFGTIHELTQAVLFLVSESASYLTGQVIHLNGGFYM